MSLFDRLKGKAAGQLIEIIDWLDDSGEILVHRFPSANQEIKMGARLTVRENQSALLVNEGKAADLFQPGLYTLTTRNIPILTTLKGWKYGFASPFKAEIYFFSTRLMADQKWGTAQPVMLRDAELGTIRLRAFGTYAYRIDDPLLFFRSFVGTRGLTDGEEIKGQLRSEVVSRFSDTLAEARVAALDLASRYEELAESARARLARAFSAFGLELTRFVVESISLPEEVQSAIDQRGRLALLSGKLEEFTRLQAAEAMTIGAAAPGGAAAAGIGLGAGAAIGQAMGQALTGALGPAAGRTPSPNPAPPAPGMVREPAWSIGLAGRPAGPFTSGEIRSMIAAGQITRLTQVTKAGAAGWASLMDWPEFADLR